MKRFSAKRWHSTDLAECRRLVEAASSSISNSPRKERSSPARQRWLAQQAKRASDPVSQYNTEKLVLRATQTFDITVSLARAGRIQELQSIHTDMKLREERMSGANLKRVITEISCGPEHVKFIKELEDEMVHQGTDHGMWCLSKLVKVFLRGDAVEDAQRCSAILLNRHKNELDEVAYRSVLACVQSPEEADEILDDMRSRSLSPTDRCYASLITALHVDHDVTPYIASALSCSPTPTAALSNAVLAFYVAHRSKHSLVEPFYTSMPVTSPKTFTLLIGYCGGYVKSAGDKHYKQAEAYFNKGVQMCIVRQTRRKGDVSALFLKMMEIYARAASLRSCLRLIEELKEFGLGPTQRMKQVLREANTTAGYTCREDGSVYEAHVAPHIKKERRQKKLDTLYTMLLA